MTKKDLKCPKFEISLWTEQQEERGEKKSWSGIVRHIQSKGFMHFRGAGALLSYMEKKAGMAHRLHPKKK